jgi:hypothetical protein
MHPCVLSKQGGRNDHVGDVACHEKVSVFICY